MTADPFGLDDEEYGPPRDRWKRPLIVPPTGGEAVPYTRASTMANYVADHSGLHTWEKRLLARGVGCHEDIAALIASVPPLHGDRRDKKTLTRKEKDEDKARNALIDGYIDSALERAGRSFKADWGTAIHGFTDLDVDWRAVPERMRADVASWDSALKAHGIEVLATETFVVNDHIQAAGTFDHLVRHPDLGVVVLDKKTGQIEDKDLAFSIQLTCYAYGEAYDWRKQTRLPLEALAGGEAVNRSVGLIAHIPLGAGRTDIYAVPLSLRYVGLANRVRQVRTEARGSMSRLGALTAGKEVA